jgi:hypothetical protein
MAEIQAASQKVCLLEPILGDWLAICANELSNLETWEQHGNMSDL